MTVRAGTGTLAIDPSEEAEWSEVVRRSGAKAN
jgi:hypothetical protein